MGTFKALIIYIRKEEKSQINIVSSNLKKVEKEEKINPKQAEEGNSKDKSTNQLN